MAICATTAVFVGCSTDDTSKYDELNAKLDLKYSQIVLTVTNTYDEESTLTSEYVMEFITGGVKVNYSVEKFAEISLDSPVYEKTTIVGEAVIAGGNIAYKSGEAVPLDALTTGAGLDFKKEYFANAELTDSYFKADVTNPGGFMGSSLNCSDMKVNATYINAFNAIAITYKAQSGHQVEYLYVFKS